MVRKPKYHIRIDVFPNGVTVTIKKSNTFLEARVFEGKDVYSKSQNWANKIIKKDKKLMEENKNGSRHTKI